MRTTSYLSWENLQATILIQGEQRSHRVSEVPRIEVFGDGILNRIGLLIEVSASVLIPPDLAALESIAIRTLSHGGHRFVELTTTNNSLRRRFYYFSIAIADRIVLHQIDTIEAIRQELSSFSNLLEPKSILTFERQLGLLGELLFLERLVRDAGTAGLACWLGPIREPHDFRVDATEFEVKTTVSTRRVHTIQSVDQLVPSHGCTPYLVSILLGPTGSARGFSLKSKVAALLSSFANDEDCLSQFRTALHRSGYEDEHSVHYQREFAFRRPIGIALVDHEFPSVTRPGITNLLGPNASRIEALQYDVNIDGLVTEDGTPEFDLLSSNHQQGPR